MTPPPTHTHTPHWSSGAGLSSLDKNNHATTHSPEQHTHIQSQTLRQPVVTSVRSLICEPMKCQADSERKQKEKGASITRRSERERENKSSSSRVGCPSSVSRRETAVAAIKVSQHICVCALFFFHPSFFKASLPVMSRGGGGNDPPCAVLPPSPSTLDSCFCCSSAHQTQSLVQCVFMN